MMKLRIRYFAAYREAVGTDEETVETSAHTADALFSECIARHEGLKSNDAALVAINDEMADWQTPLNEGDDVLFFPPVAGG